VLHCFGKKLHFLLLGIGIGLGLPAPCPKNNLLLYPTFCLSTAYKCYTNHLKLFMKKIIASVLVLLMYGTCNAQSTTTVYDSIVHPQPLQPVAGEAAPAGLYSLDMVDRDMPLDSGFVAGTNHFPVITGTATLTGTYSETAVKYYVSGTASVVGVFVGVANHKGTSTIKAKIYGQDAISKGPGTQLGASSVPRAINYLNGYGHGFDILNFTTPIVVSNQVYFASVVSPQLGGPNNDTLCILNDHDIFTPQDSIGWLYQQTFSDTVALQSKWISNQNCYMVFPVIDMSFTTGINKVTVGNLSLFAASPNPTNGHIDINFALQTTAEVEVQVYDLAGNILKSIKTNTLAQGTNKVGVDLADLAAGSYLYSVNATGKKVFSKFVVVQ